MKPLTSIELHVLTSDHRPGQVFNFSCPKPGEVYTADVIDTLIAELVVRLMLCFPGNEFDIKKLSRRKYNIIPRLIAHA